LADIVGSFLLVPFRLTVFAVPGACCRCGDRPVWHDPSRTSITGFHLPAISTSEIHNLSYKDS
jgi:hypothetical protein